MPRQHPVHDTIAALTRIQRMRIEITPTVSYKVPAPCLLQQLAEELGVSGNGSGGRTVPGSRALIATDAWDLWVQIQTSVHTWARELELDRRPYLQRVRGGQGLGRPARQRQPAPWYQQLHLTDDTPAEVLTHLGDRLGAVKTTPPPDTARQLVPDPGRVHELPPVGRLLRLVAATATSRGLDPIADAIHRNAVRWHAQIEAMLNGVQEQRAVRGAACPQPDCAALCTRHREPYCEEPGCAPTAVLEHRDDGTYLVPAIVLVQRDIAGEQLQWLACLACGWSRGAGELLQATIASYLQLLADCWRRLHQLHPPRPERTPA